MLNLAVRKVTGRLQRVNYGTQICGIIRESKEIKTTTVLLGCWQNILKIRWL
jgi:hypothetical protein